MRDTRQTGRDGNHAARTKPEPQEVAVRALTAASQQTDRPHDPDAPVNLFEPADGRYGHDFGAHGVFGDRTIGWDPQLWASRHHGMLDAVGVAALSGLVRRLWNRW